MRWNVVEVRSGVRSVGYTENLHLYVMLSTFVPESFSSLSTRGQRSWVWVYILILTRSQCVSLYLSSNQNFQHFRHSPIRNTMIYTPETRCECWRVMTMSLEIQLPSRLWFSTCPGHHTRVAPLHPSACSTGLGFLAKSNFSLER